MKGKQSKERKGRLVQNRSIEINTYDLGNHQVRVEGKLADRRYPPKPAESEGEPKVIHDLVARIWVQGPDLTICKVEAEMPRIPMNMCPEVLPLAQKLVGLKIITGFSQKVKDLIGGAEGCSHLTHLFVNLGPLAVQGYFAAYGRAAGKSLGPPALSRLVDSCYLWRKDGPLVRSLTAPPSTTKGG